jgi:circadian clock protein KaiB
VKTNTSGRATKAFEKALGTRPTGKHILRLFVAGATARSRQAVLRIRQLCEAEPEGDYDLEVIDIYQQPNRARANQIVATPTLIKELPLPVRRFIGSLLNITGLFVQLDLITKGKIAV